MTFLVMALLAAAPGGSLASHLKGLEKPKKEQRGTLGESESAKGKVKIHCIDAGASMLVEIDDPGLMGSKEVWLRKKAGDVMPPCDANEAGVTHVTGIPGYGYVAGLKSDFLFATSADSVSDRAGLRVFSLTTGDQIYETEFNLDQPFTITAEGKSLMLRFHVAVTSTCNPLGAEAESCWKEIRESARIPEGLEIKPPPCDAVFKNKTGLPSPALIALPAEVDLSAPKTLKYRAGAATCIEST